MADEKQDKQQKPKGEPKGGAPKSGAPKGGAPKGGAPKQAGAKSDGKAEQSPKEKAPRPARVMPRLLDRYRKEIAPALVKEFNYSNAMQVPHVSKVVVNIGIGEALANAKALDAAVKDLTTITGQKPLVRKAKKSIATFKLREGQAIGV